MPTRIQSGARDLPSGSDADRESGSTTAPPRSVLAVAIAAMVLGIFVTPDLLIALGPMRTSLSSPIASVRHVAMAEFTAFQVVCLCCALAPYFWRPIASSSIARRVLEHEPEETAVAGRSDGPINFSLVAMSVCVAVGLVYVAFGERLLSRSQLVEINREDGVIEYGTALLFLVSSVVSAVLAFRRRRQGRRAAVFGLFAVLFFAMCGEEISWGQRILGMETLEVFEATNVQSENNLHNLFGYAADHLFILGVFAYGAVFPLLARKIEFFRKLFDYVGLPIASPGLAVGFLAVSCIHGWTVGRIASPLLGLRVAELRELLSALGFLLLMIETWRKAPGAPRATSAPA